MSLSLPPRSWQSNRGKVIIRVLSRVTWKYGVLRGLKQEDID